MLTSFLVNNIEVQIYILTEGLTPDNQKIIREEVTDKGGRDEIYLVASFIVKKFPMPNENGLSQIGRAIYYQILMAELLPTIINWPIEGSCYEREQAGTVAIGRPAKVIRILKNPNE